MDPLAIKLAVAARGWESVSLITDANIWSGLPPDTYETPWGFKVNVAPGKGARIAEGYPRAGALAGSALTMNVGMANLLEWLDLPPEKVWAMGTRNPAAVARMDRLGCLEVGATADLVLLNEDLTPAYTWVGGRCVYKKE